MPWYSEHWPDAGREIEKMNHLEACQCGRDMAHHIKEIAAQLEAALKEVAELKVQYGQLEKASVECQRRCQELTAQKQYLEDRLERGGIIGVDSGKLTQD